MRAHALVLAVLLAPVADKASAAAPDREAARYRIVDSRLQAKPVPIAPSRFNLDASVVRYASGPGEALGLRLDARIEPKGGGCTISPLVFANGFESGG